MAKIEIKKDEKAGIEPNVPVSQSKLERQALVDRYAKQNPAKYEAKKAALAKWVEAGV